MPPGSAKASRRAATLTPSPKMSLSSIMMSPRLTPMRKSMRPSAGTPALRAAISRCTSTAQRTASTTLEHELLEHLPALAQAHLRARPLGAVVQASAADRHHVHEQCGAAEDQAALLRDTA